MKELFQLAVICQTWTLFVYGQFGFGGMGWGMGGMAGGNMGQHFNRNSFLARSLRDIVHPNAEITLPIRQIAMRHRGPPSTRAMLLDYTPHFVELGFQHGVTPNGTVGQPSYQAMEHHMVEQAIKFMNISGVIRPTEMNNMHELLSYIKQLRNTSQSSNAPVPTPALSDGRIGTPATGSGSTNQVAAPVSVQGSANQGIGPAYSTGQSPIVAATAGPDPNALFNDYMMMQLLTQNNMELGLGEMAFF